eukprot:CAMPEP_0117539040 /NCGR_PEP_ID=MMETSP0784-20121206/42784_1 /TAXON_ID=39447 /ORGANISM="" /LENGTH=64 /DNA_ID=CAMNT_0005335663 /DNA_START=1041 /DNA_END=1235 /DNA_ORIENTATION=+
MLLRICLVFGVPGLNLLPMAKLKVAPSKGTTKRSARNGSSVIIGIDRNLYSNKTSVAMIDLTSE